jgi:hypothetical protein
VTYIPGSSEPWREPPGQPPPAPLPAQYAPQQPQIIVVPQQQTPSSTLATLSLIFGILGLVTACCSFGLPSAAAVVLGHFALHETKDGKKGGNGMAVAGLVIGYIVVIPAVILSIMAVFGGLLNDVNPSPTPTP